MRILSNAIPKSIRQLARTWIDHLAFERKLRRATPVLVYQMGKVGSLSVHGSLVKQYPGVVVHAHRFDADHSDQPTRRLYRWTLAEARPLNVISLTREPVSRNVSAFFQCFERETGMAPRDAAFSIEQLTTMFVERFDHELPLNWFDRHIRANLGIDVYATPFPEDGVGVYVSGRIRLLVIRSEMDDGAKEQAIGSFLDLPGFQLSNTNRAEEKDYAALYQQFRRDAVLPESYIATMRSSRYYGHFYGQLDRES